MIPARSSGLAKVFSSAIVSCIRPLKPKDRIQGREYSGVNMAEYGECSNGDHSTIQPCKHLIVQLPSENYKVVDLKPKTTISLGKFGSFHADELIGKPFGPSWEILPSKEIRLFEREEQDEEEDDVNLRDNRDVFDDKTAQLLTSEEINNFRSGMTSKEIISTIVSNNVNFEKKSAFSQEKYLRSKEQRFLRAFTPVQPTVGNVCEFLWSDRRERCMDLSVETIGLMLSLANVCAGGRYLVLDETGLLIAAILERGASVFLLHENQEPGLDILKYFPHLQKQFKNDSVPADSSEPTFHSMDFLSAFHPESIILTPPKEGGNLYERKLRTYNRELEVHKIWKEAGFDGLISVSSFDSQSYLPQCLNRLELCANIVIYSPFKEPIVDLQNFCQTKLPTRPILAPSIHEIRAPKWNTLKGRVRPDMQGRGGGGWVFSGTRVEESEPETRDWKEGKRKKRKVEGMNGTEMEEVKTDSAMETE